MNIGRVSYELTRFAVLFELVGDDDRFVCAVSLDQLDPERGGMIDGDEGLQIFEARRDEIRGKATEQVAAARQAGVTHTPGKANEPIYIIL